MKHNPVIKQARLVLGLGFAIFSAVCCTKPVDTGNVPHKPVSSEFQGTFISAHIRAPQVDQGGHYTDGLSWGTVFNIKPDGSGTHVFRYDINYYAGGSKNVRIETDAAYEITSIDASHADIIVHFIRGKNYEDGKFLHDLDASKIYPNGDFVFRNVEYGVNGQGKTYFVASADDTFTQK
ncbi:MAG: hypothetical protein INR73_16020 [Williamsia sp.]|nr:hypothetical protein [Williamsia sp.]